MKGSVSSPSLPIPSQAAGVTRTLVQKKVQLCSSFPNWLCWWWARWKGWSWPWGHCRCRGHCPFSSQRSSPAGGEHLRSSDALGQGEANCQAVARATATGPQLAGWRQKTSVKNCGLISQANSCVKRRSPCSYKLPCTGRVCGGSYCGQYMVFLRFPCLHQVLPGFLRGILFLVVTVYFPIPYCAAVMSLLGS